MDSKLQVKEQLQVVYGLQNRLAEERKKLDNMTRDHITLAKNTLVRHYMAKWIADDSPYLFEKDQELVDAIFHLAGIGTDRKMAVNTSVTPTGDITISYYSHIQKKFVFLVG